MAGPRVLGLGKDEVDDMVWDIQDRMGREPGRGAAARCNREDVFITREKKERSHARSPEKKGQCELATNVKYVAVRMEVVPQEKRNQLVLPTTDEVGRRREKGLVS